MAHSTRAKRIEARRLARILSGVDSTNGNHPPQAKRWTSATIMRYAGQPGMLGVRRSRKLCGYRHATPSKY